MSENENPLGKYHRYEYKRTLFPDYPRPAIWPDGYYVPTSTGDDVIQKHACVAERAKMLMGEPAREQCIVVEGVNFLNNADIDEYQLPPAGAPNVMMAAGGTQLKGDLAHDGIYVWQFHVDWSDTSRTTLTGPEKVPVAPYQASDPPGTLGFAESIVAQGNGSQRSTLRWEDYTTLAMDPDDCRFWYVGDYFMDGAASYSTRIAAWRLPGCNSVSR